MPATFIRYTKMGSAGLTRSAIIVKISVIMEEDMQVLEKDGVSKKQQKQEGNMLSSLFHFPGKQKYYKIRGKHHKKIEYHRFF